MIRRILGHTDTYTGRHRAPDPAPDDYSPLDPAVRQEIAPTHYADRQIHADVTDRTGLLDLDAITAGEVSA